MEADQTTNVDVVSPQGARQSQELIAARVAVSSQVASGEQPSPTTSQVTVSAIETTDDYDDDDNSSYVRGYN